MGDEANPAMKPAPSEQAVFAEALLRDTPESRTAYLDAACGTDDALRQRVEALLRASENAGDFLEEPATALAGEESTTAVTQLSEKPGDKIGRYKLLEQIGEGGCGVVYMAEQFEPVRRRVALKVIKLGMDTKSVIARFEAERQALALMDHPNIAKVLDGGATQTGRLYFVMELVRGVRITQYCDEARLSTRARLQLFVQVCQAIQHAHQKGIIHRDLKPSNILVTVNDGAPVPKVIDFGIAKATGQSLTDKTVFTQFHAFIGTPAYISPEQAEMSSVDVDTRSDIYALGVLLYELLTGRTPFDGDELLRCGLDEMRRVIRDDEPPRPSTRLSTLGLAEATALSTKRQTTVPQLAGAARGDLDCIVMKCLEKDRSRRYETANGLTADIQRHLNNEQVSARPPSAIYWLRKLARRNRGALIAASIVLAALFVAVFTLAASNARIRRERNQKDQALKERGAALNAAREQLFLSLQSQADARRHSGQPGQRLESLAALAEAARIRPDANLRDNAIAAMALPDVQAGGIAWPAPQSEIAAFDTAYQRFARCTPDGIISIRTIPGNHELKRLESGPFNVADYAAFSPDGRFLAHLRDHSKLLVWRWESGESVFKSPPEKCSVLVFSPDSRQLAVAQEASITCFDLRTGEPIQRWQTRERPYRMDFDPAGRRLAVSYYLGPKVVSIYNADTGAEEAALPIGVDTGSSIAWHPEGELLATGDSDGRIQLWEVKTQQRLGVLEGHVEHVSSLSFHPGGELLLSTSWDGRARLWQPSPGRLLMRLSLTGWFAFNSASRWAGVVTSSKDELQLWEVVTGAEYRTFFNHFASGARELREGDISPDGTLLVLGGSDGVRLWDVACGREVARLRMGETPKALFSSSGRELLTCGPSDGLQRWNIEPNSGPGGGLQIGRPHPVPLPFVALRMAKSSNDTTLAIVGDGQSALLNLMAESPRPPAMLHGMVDQVAVTSKGERMATSGWFSQLVKVWDRQSGKLIKELESGTSLVFFTPNDRELIVACAKEFIFYNMDTFEVNRRIPRAAGLYPGHVAFTGDGKLMALELAPGVIHLKEITSGQTVAKLEDPYGDISTWMSFTPDGTQLVVVARYASAIHRWDLRAIRARLKPMNLDWDWPEFPSPLPDKAVGGPSHQPLRVHVIGPDPTAATPAFSKGAPLARP